VTDLIFAIISLFGISFWYYLPYTSLFLNSWYFISICYIIAYDCLSIYYYSINKHVDTIFIDLSITTIVLGSIATLFGLIRKCIGIDSIWDRLWDDNFSETSSNYYAIRDILNNMCRIDDCHCEEITENCEYNCCDYCCLKYRNSFKEAARKRKNKIPTSFSSNPRPNPLPTSQSNPPTSQYIDVSTIPMAQPVDSKLEIV
jgi:hypothetical protein